MMQRASCSIRIVFACCMIICLPIALFLFAFQTGFPLSPSNYTAHHADMLFPSPSSQNFNLSITSGPCTCSLHLPAYPQVFVNCHCSQFPNASIPACPPSSDQQLQQSLLPEKLVLKEIVPEPCPPQVVHNVIQEPWYVKDKVWHYPVRFPRCTMDACFNYSRCDKHHELLVYSYNQPTPPVKYFHLLNQTRWHTDDPEKACLFFVFLDTPGLYRPAMHPNDLPHWNGGLNHVLITFNDKWLAKGPNSETIGFASVMISDMHETNYRPGFDVSIPLPAFRHLKELQHLKPFDRKYLLTFRGLRYITSNMKGEGLLRSHDSFRQMHNGEDVIVATSCKHPINDEYRKNDPSLGIHCDEDDAAYSGYNFNDLMNSTFGLAPAGIQPNSYRFAEILSAGTIPVLIADNYVKPYDTLVQWHRCILQFPSTEMHRIVPAVRGMRRKEVERRQEYCLHVYNEMFASEEKLLGAAMEAQKVRFMGAFPAWGDGDGGHQ